MTYNFYGCDTADCVPVNDNYKSIANPVMLYDILSEIWCEYTCAPRMRIVWSENNKTLGQCSITAFLVQDIFGGEVYGILRKGGNYHCYNVVGDRVFDLTSEQFGEEKLCYENNPIQSREIHFAKEEKRLRYEYLKAELNKKLSAEYTVLKIFDEDYGCEGVPDGEEAMCCVLVSDENGNEKWLKYTDSYLTTNNIGIGSKIKVI